MAMPGAKPAATVGIVCVTFLALAVPECGRCAGQGLDGPPSASGWPWNKPSMDCFDDCERHTSRGFSPLAAAASGGGRLYLSAARVDDRVRSAGRWNVASVDWEGTPVDPEFLALLQVVYRPDGSWAVMLGRLPVAEGTSTNDQDRLPKTFEMATLGSAGIEPRRYSGIYRLDGDTRVLCIVPAGKPRPGDFSAPKRSGRMLVTLTRAQPPDAGR